MKTLYYSYAILFRSLSNYYLLFILLFSFLPEPGLHAFVDESPPGDPPAIEDLLYYESYEVENEVLFLLPRGTSAEDMTEWDWIEMQPYREVRRHQSQMDRNMQSAARIDILETDRRNKWDHHIGHLIIGAGGSEVYNAKGKLISQLPHSEFYRASKSENIKHLMEHGFAPRTALTTYEELSAETIQGAGYRTGKTKSGYRIWNEQEEITVDLSQYAVSHRLLGEEKYHVPYYTFQSYTLSSQGYLIPVLKKTYTRIRSENGLSVIKVESHQYRKYKLYYDPQMVYKEEQSSVASDFAVYPNPMREHLDISYTGKEYENSKYSVRIMNPTTGETLWEESRFNTGTTERVNTSGLPAGFYMVRITIKGITFTRKIFKN